MEKLFLLKADFADPKRDAQKKYFCPDCTPIEGLLSYYPQLRKKLEITYLDFQRPRKVLVDLIGEANQGCPVLVREDGTFINEVDKIAAYLTKTYHIGEQH